MTITSSDDRFVKHPTSIDGSFVTSTTTTVIDAETKVLLSINKVLLSMLDLMKRSCEEDEK